jgi:hypothetical protein
MALDMDPGIRAQWTAALRSGGYLKATGYLRDGDRRCCLGVLCDLAAKDGILEAVRRDGTLFWSYDGRSDYLPESVQDWAGLNSGNPQVCTPSGVLPLGVLNDGDNDDEGEWDFARIADAIDGGAK